MATPYFLGQTLDDVMHSVIDEILANGETIHPSKGECKEITGVLLEIANPRARLSRTETRGKPFSCLGELCWYLAKSNQVDFISYYLSRYREFADGDEVFCGYGPRLFEWEGINQVLNVTSRLRANPVSRKAVIQLFDRHDIVEEHNDVACTCTLQLMIRGNSLHMFTHMRSNDVFKGFPHDVFCFTMLQEIIARSLSVEIGTYKHAVGSLHLYETDYAPAHQFLDEGWQSTEIAMPPMPAGDPWPAIGLLLQAEAAIRNDQPLDTIGLESIDPYWADLVRLLRVFRCKRDDRPEEIKLLRNEMSSRAYQPFIDKIINQRT